ncbi:olfactory receptor 52E8-like [Leptodactylus fuscus]|uniref:olfactory receptor 52E8-like n=1 Tax=Leptodactylus fuscus TaxID=238119 RepID=UPI003F4F30F2
MDNQNTSFSSHTEFLILGFPDFLEHRSLLIVPFLIVYMAILMGNCLIMSRIWVEKTLQSPMYTLISVLFAVNVSCTTAIMPPFLLSLVFSLFHISLGGCLVQMFFIYLSVVLESSVVVFMALDRYVAICRPLRYHDIMTARLLLLIMVVGLLRGVLLVCPIVISVSKVRFCGSNIIQSFACENMALLNLGCGDISKGHITGLFVRIFVSVFDGSLILISYLDILRTAMKIIRGPSLNKALHTCGTHLMVVMLIYTCGFLSSIVYRISNSIPVNLQNVISAIYFFFPAMVNPIIYGFRVKEIRICLENIYGKRKRKIKKLTQRFFLLDEVSPCDLVLLSQLMCLFKDPAPEPGESPESHRESDLLDSGVKFGPNKSSVNRERCAGRRRHLVTSSHLKPKSNTKILQEGKK